LDLEAIDRVKTEIGANLKRAATARRSILAAAFSGQLVPQDPSDDPASVLLRRIAVEQAASGPTRENHVSS
jgi:type I restriction enzyme S subunit